MADPDPPPPQLMLLLPDDVLQEHILRRLPPRALAAASCVCRSWRAAVDARGALRRARDLLPLSVGGLFFDVSTGRRDAAPPVFFAPPAMGPRVASRLASYVPAVLRPYESPGAIVDCCNGLLLVYGGLVVNPATRRFARVPPCPDEQCMGITLNYAYLAFDPSVSPHYEVAVVPDPWECDDVFADVLEWPPPAYGIWVYSSGTGSWEKRPFVREGGPAEVRSGDYEPENRHAAYWRGSLYVHCQSDLIIKMTLSDHKYQVIKLPAGVSASVYYSGLRLAKSKNGVYLGLVHDHRYQLQVWYLDESGAQTEWMLKYDTNLKAIGKHFYRNRDYPVDRPWMILPGDNYNYNLGTKYQWSFDKWNILEIEANDDENFHAGYMTIFGFHPNRELAFLQLSRGRFVACHLDSSKVQDLGDLVINRYDIEATYVYTPCWMGDLSENNY